MVNIVDNQALEIVVLKTTDCMPPHIEPVLDARRNRTGEAKGFPCAELASGQMSHDWVSSSCALRS